MKIRMRSLAASANGTLFPGQVYDLPDEEAMAFIPRYAEPIDLAPGMIEEADKPEDNDENAKNDPDDKKSDDETDDKKPDDESGEKLDEDNQRGDDSNNHPDKPDDEKPDDKGEEQNQGMRHAAPRRAGRR